GRDVVVVDNYANSSPRVIEALRALTSADLVAVEADLRDRHAMRRAFDIHGVDEVIHFAAHKAVGESVEKPLAYYDNNLGSTISLLEVMADAGVRRLVFSSS
ncbi:MAG: NAD-dependent epimerase/dehydratase family protein, partial [Actinobacteria bacterium]|nr:NAD-dependent epimerase/dehydratase family protein [Actinomycetota bacterium]NIS28980.1 NAD-dependent epimerase/dehydratase family protein [Actinomycetota bacterium]NIT94277.1 NAD-dependent epimerase/dehydratase family protein [Actinomycetota bacterium]NIU17879.1 NAD-dependent epimerase/dehydratase family protein [Actinomycetota bacterium]NIU64402.1 NAD-dependent epimerase/dehydratase family protein [Actinomycetota bacterium]